MVSVKVVEVRGSRVRLRHVQRAVELPPAVPRACLVLTRDGQARTAALRRHRCSLRHSLHPRWLCIVQPLALGG